jgi:polyribonucleotide nucleotidyltransferase
VLALTEQHGDEWIAGNKSFVNKYFDKLKKSIVRQVMLSEGIRLDGRKYAEIRPIWCEVDYLPSTHGSAIFNRGETQALTSLTLGTKLDEAMIDTAMEMSFDKFLLHYNFPGFSVGEVKPQRAPARREVGHAHLAGRSLRQVLPVSPYTIRIVSDILESNGSSSMATVCAGSMALMDAGIPIPGHVAGIAMGMIAEGGKIAILSDILGDEDALGDMDFKVTGTEKGITGCQMDIKIDGLPYEQLGQALSQAREGRLHIINCMKEAIEVPNSDYKPHAPRIVELHIDRSTIGALIGPGGSIVQELQRSTGAVITITEDESRGIVNISSPNKDSIEAAVTRVKMITHIPEIGNVYDAVVDELTEFGAFVNFMGRKGLLHVSEISYTRVEKVEDVLAVGDKIQIKVLDIDKGKFRLSMRALQTPPEGFVPRPSGPRPGGGRDDRRGGGRDDRRGGGRDDRRGGGRDDRGPRR